jgi:hypothetical protein
MTIQVNNPTDNSKWGQVSMQYNERKVRFPFHIDTREVYNGNPANLIRLKCAALTVGTPFITLVRSVYWLGKAVIDSLVKFYCYLDGQPTTLSIAATAWEGIRVLEYGAKLTKTAFLGICHPIEARMAYGRLERELNRQIAPHRDKFYLAICCQPLAILPEDTSPHNLVAVENKLTRYVAKIDALRSTIWTMDIAEFYGLFAKDRHAPVPAKSV